jgi:hypothetical protein
MSCHETTLTVGVAALALLVANACGKEQSPAEKLANSVHDRAASLCRPWFGSSLPNVQDRFPTEEGQAPAKALAFEISGNNENTRPDYVSIPSSIEATTESELHSVICQQNTDIEQGTYSGGGIGGKADSIIVILSWPEGTPLLRKQFLGGDAPKSTTGTLGAQGAVATSDINAWLPTVIK